MENPHLVLHYRRLDIVLQEFLQNPHSFHAMNFSIQRIFTNKGERVYKDWRTADWAQRITQRIMSNVLPLPILLFCDETMVIIYILNFFEII